VAHGQPQNKALAFNSCVRQLKELVSAAEFDTVLAALPEETRALVAAPPLPIEWLPYRHTFALIRTAHDLAFRGDEGRTTEIARRAIASDMTLVHKLFIRFASPEYVLGRAARLWTSYWRDNGTLRVQSIQRGHVRVFYEDQQHATPLFWAMQRATIQGLADATRLGPVTVSILEKAETRCTMEVRW
jgi:hypothetical protein